MKRLGEILVDKKWIDPQVLEEGLLLQKKWGLPIGETLIGMGALSPRKLYQSLAELWGMEYIDLRYFEISEKMLNKQKFNDYIEKGYIPIEMTDDGIARVAVIEPSKTLMDLCLKEYPLVEFVLTSRYDLKWAHQAYLKEHAVIDAQERLFFKDRDSSAKIIFTPISIIVIGLFVLIFSFFVYQLDWKSLAYFNLALHLFYFLTIIYKIFISMVGLNSKDHKITLPSDMDCPIYSILVPLYKEARTLPQLAQALKNLDYPRAKLDVKIILEEDDLETIAKSKELGLEHLFDIIIVPPSKIRTKPKALNYALPFVRGEFVTIYDGEDVPERDQLKKAVAIFRSSDSSLACLQARLNYFNHGENILTGCFALEYAHWFDFQLQGLSNLNWPIPLGGTSNHFKTEVIKKVLGWDPYNVTEDADLGMRFSVHGHEVHTLNSTTWEEAPIHFSIWLKQRTRWNKGHLITLIVYLRHPIRHIKTMGLKAFFSLQFFIGGPMLLNLMNPFVIGAFIWWFIEPDSPIFKLYNHNIIWIGFMNLIATAIFSWVFGMIAMKRRNLKTKIISLFIIPVYQLAQSLSTYRALIQIITKPHLWEKTPHGESSYLGHEAKDL